MAKEAEEDNQYRQQLEQERRDHELAMRLAQESNSQVDDSPLLMRKYEFDSKILLLLFVKKLENIFEYQQRDSLMSNDTFCTF